MGKIIDALTPALSEFIAAQKMFFVATAPSSGRINLSPKGLNSFRVLGPNRVAYLDLTGSGAETAAHLAENGRITVMFCSFEGAPLILRLYGRGRSVLPGTEDWQQLRPLFGPALAGERELIVIEVDSVHTSCGFGVPLYDYAGERTLLIDWCVKKGEDGLERYRSEKNAVSIDGLPTGIVP